MKQKSRFCTARRILIFWTLFIGVGAAAGAAGMLLDPSGKAMGMDAMLPYFQVLPFAEVVFQDFNFSGWALLIVNGLTNLTAAGLLLAKKRAGVVLGGVFGVTLMLWICIQFYMFPFNFMSTAYFIFGLIQAITGYAACVFYRQELFAENEHAYPRVGKGGHKVLVVYFSRMGYARKLAMEAANATGALNTALCGLLGPGDHVITTVCEHNSVLRPLYRLRTQGVQLSFAGVDAKGRLQYEKWEELVRPNTRALVVTGASNVTGNCTDLAKAAAFAHRHGLLLIVDAAQTAGAQSIDVQALGVDVLCFTGHKALLGPQGTGGLYVRPGVQIAPLVVGGSGVHSYDEQHPAQMPTALEAGTLNVHGLAGLCAGVQWLLTQGVETLAAREAALARCFYEEVCGMPGVTVYGDIETALRAPIVSLNIGDEDSARVADILWEDYGICVRAGAHCAPLMHKALGTVEQGVVRFSFSHSNTMEEALHAAQAVRELAQEL